MNIIARLAILLIAALLSIAALAAGFKGVPFDSGIAFAPTEAVSGPISRAGGGVVLRDVAACKLSPQTLCDSIAMTLVAGPTKSALQIAGRSCRATYSVENWAVKAAIDLVESESSLVYRNVTLLGKPTDSEVQRLSAHGISRSAVYFVEVSPALANTKAGETLLMLDLLLTDAQHYAEDKSNALELRTVLRSSGVGNWTWTDESAMSSFGANCKQGILQLRGEPRFTFLSRYDKSALDLALDNQIQALHPTLVRDATEFARVAAFMRHVRNSSPTDWTQIYRSSRLIGNTAGSTPRMVRK